LFLFSKVLFWLSALSITLQQHRSTLGWSLQVPHSPGPIAFRYSSHLYANATFNQNQLQVFIQYPPPYFIVPKHLKGARPQSVTANQGQINGNVLMLSVSIVVHRATALCQCPAEWVPFYYILIVNMLDGMFWWSTVLMKKWERFILRFPNARDFISSHKKVQMNDDLLETVTWAMMLPEQWYPEADDMFLFFRQ
jgi:hypothetical protein